MNIALRHSAFKLDMRPRGGKINNCRNWGGRGAHLAGQERDY